MKLSKTNKIIHTVRNSDIEKVQFTKNGHYVITSGTGQDTTIQIYDANNGTQVESIAINEIQNVDMKLTPDEKYLTISTYMFELAVIEFKRSEKFNKDSGAYEETIKIQRNKSLGGIKVPISDYEFSNDNNFFVVSTENRKIKIFQNWGNVEDSKVYFEFDVKERNFKFGERVALYVSSFFNGKITGYVAISCDNNIMIYDTEGKVRISI